MTILDDKDHGDERNNDKLRIIRSQEIFKVV